MMDTAVIIRAFNQLRDMCDPRGHDLLDAIEETLVDAVEAVEKLDAMFQTLTAAEIVDWRDNTRWSRRAEPAENVRRVGVHR